MSKLSLAMIVKNEADVLAPCLDSVRGLVDEIVVVDTGSTDGTPGLARELGAQVQVFPWIDDFSAARNESLRHCSGDWVLVLDADEEVDRASWGEIRRIVASEADSAIRLTIRNYLSSGLFTTVDFAPKANVSDHTRYQSFLHQVDFKALRLFRRLPGIRYTGRIHELVDEAFESRGLAIGASEAMIHHFGKTMASREDVKRAYYLGLARQDAQDHPHRKQAHFNLLQQSLNAQDWPTALEAAQAYVRLSATGPSLVLFGGGLAFQSLGHHQEALAWFQRLLEAHPDHAAGWTRKAVSLALLDRPQEAEWAFEQALAHGSHYSLAYVNYAEWALKAGRWDQARSILERGLRVQPGEATLWSSLVELGIHQQRLDLAARDAALGLQAVPAGGGGLWHRLIVLSLLQANRPDKAQKMLLNGLQVFPGHPDLLAMQLRLSLPQQ